LIDVNWNFSNYFKKKN